MEKKKGFEEMHTEYLFGLFRLEMKLVFFFMEI